MRRVLVRYQVRPEHAAANRRLVEEVFAALAAATPPGLRYATFVEADGVSFVHLASIETADGVNPLAAVAAFQRFTATLGERAVAPPTVTELDPIGSYRLLDDRAELGA